MAATAGGGGAPETGLDRELAAGLAAARRAGLFRELHPLSTGPGPWVYREGRRCLNLASNNYLGLATHPEVVAAARAALEVYGAGAGASRLVTGDLEIHRQLEEVLASLKGAEAALVFPSGYAANVGVLTALAGRRDHLFCDALNHASLFDGCRLSGARLHVYRHADPGHLETLLREAPAVGRRFVVTDGVFSMDGDVAPLPALVSLAERYGATLVVDDAHATAVLGPGGAGTAHLFGLGDRVPVQVGTLSKALGAQGGFVAGSRRLVEFLVNRARPFIFSTGLAPASAAAALAALRVAGREPWRRERVVELAARFRRAVAQALGPRDGVDLRGDGTPIVPVVLGDPARALRVAARLLERGVLAPAIRPPAVPRGTSRIRVSFMASHSDTDLELAVEAFATALRAG